MQIEISNIQFAKHITLHFTSLEMIITNLITKYFEK